MHSPPGLANRADWLEECTAAIARHTVHPEYEVAVADGDDGLPGLLKRARRNGARYVVALHADALPVRNGWLTEIIAQLDRGATAVVADPGLLATTAELAARDGLEGARTAAGAVELPRSSRNSVHPASGIWGDLVYHHAACESNGLGDRMLFAHREEFLEWVRGTAIAERVFFVLGMHRSGTSSLVAALEQCGINLGDVERRNFGQPHGNLEQHRALLINDAVLAAAGGDWRSPPPSRVSPSPAQAADMASLARELEAGAPSALKDPRAVFTIDGWVAAASSPALVGTFRHPEAVARSFREREQIPEAEAYELWRAYNEQLVDLHRQHRFPLIEFDLTDRDAYCRTVAAFAAEARLAPRLGAILAVVEEAFDRTTVLPDAPVPAPCAEAYAYLRRHRYRGELEPGSLAALLAEWGAAAGPVPEPAVRQRIDLLAWRALRRLPRPVRTGVYRAARRLRSR